MKPGVFFSVVLYAFAGAVFTAAGVNQPGFKAIHHFAPQHAILSVPVLCYHNIKANSTGHNTLYTISINRFKEQVRMLKDSGYSSLLPWQLYDYYHSGTPIPSKSIIISFDDARVEDFLIATPVLKDHGFRAVFFIMTVAIGKKGYMSAAQIRELSDSGNAIGLHTYNHPDLRKLSTKDWSLQIDKPAALLKSITAKPVTSFAYPFGAWNADVVAQLKARGIAIAFQLDGKTSSADPVYTIRRLIPDGTWTGTKLYKEIQLFSTKRPGQPYNNHPSG